MVIDNGQESGSGSAACGKVGETLCCASCGIAEVDDVKLMRSVSAGSSAASRSNVQEAGG
eukprot:scaffold3343_cov99-Skeletonema_marinoi.AAC.11